MRVTVYHNIATDGSGRRAGYEGYQPAHPLVPVFAYTISPPSDSPPEVAAGFAYSAFNADPDMLTGTQRDLAETYRRRRLRSLTPGDVLTIGDTKLAAARPAGWQPITAPLHIVRADEHGTHPLDLEEVISLTLTFGESESYPDLVRRLISTSPHGAPSTALAEEGGAG